MVSATTKLVFVLLTALSVAQRETTKNPAAELHTQTEASPVNLSPNHRTINHHLETAKPETLTTFNRTSTTSTTWSQIPDSLKLLSKSPELESRSATDPTAKHKADHHEADSGGNSSNQLSLDKVLSSIGSIESSMLKLAMSSQFGPMMDRIKDKFAHPMRTALEVVQLFRVPLPEGVSEPCGQHVRLAINELLATAIESRNPLFEWSVQMFDAIAKPVPGIMRGAINIPGSYSQCVNIVVANNGTTGTAGARPGDSDVAFVGEHCVVNLELSQEFQNSTQLNKLQSYLSLQYAFCFPNTCNIGDKNKLIASLATKMSLEARVEEKMCHTKIGPPMDSVAIWLSVLLIIPVMLVLAATIFDCWRSQTGNTSDGQEITETGVAAHARRYFLGFSATRSFKKLLEVPVHPEATYSFILGIRALAIAWVVYGHAYIWALFPDMDVPMSELLNAFDMAKNWLIAVPLYGAIYSVDTFLFLSGFSSIYFFLQMKATHNFSVLDYLSMYPKRYTRLTPALIYVIIFVAGPWRFLWNGPYWSTIAKQSDSCRKFWWSDLLYVGNLHENVEPKEFCQIQFWFLAVDMQMFLIVPPLLFVIIRKPKWGLPALVTSLLTLSIVRAIINYTSNNTLYMKLDLDEIKKNVSSITLDYQAVAKAYTYPWMRGHIYIMGMILGLIQHRVKETGILLSRHVVVIGWITCISITSVSCSLNYLFNNGYVAPTFEIKYFVGLTTTSVWGLAIGWIVFACINGYGGFVTMFLSCQLLVVLGRLSYGIFLVHIMIELSGVASSQTAIVLDSFNSITFAIILMVLSIAVATALYVVVEAPVSNFKFGVAYVKKRNFPHDNGYTLLSNNNNDSVDRIPKSETSDATSLTRTEEQPVKTID